MTDLELKRLNTKKLKFADTIQLKKEFLVLKLSTVSVELGQ
jgi:hypothetical protein